MDKEKKRTIEKGAEKTGDVIGKIVKTGLGAVNGVGKGFKKGISKKK